MGSAHYLTQVNTLQKFHENLLKSSGDMEGTRNARLKHVTFNCDLDLGSVWVLHTASVRRTFD